MIYLLVLEIFTLLLVVCLKFGVVYLLVRAFNKAITLGKLLKVVLLFELGAFLFYLVSSALFSLNSAYFLLIFPISFGRLYILFVPPLVLGIIFASLMRRFDLLNLKKATIVFIIIFLVMTPFVSFLSIVVGQAIFAIPIFERAITETLQTNPSFFFDFDPLSSQLPLPLRVVSFLDNSVMQQYWISNLRSLLL